MSALLLVPGFGASAAAEQPVNAMAPYEAFVDPDTFFSGAVLDLKKEGDVHAWITRELENMKYGYNINTLNIYGLEGFDSGDSNENKDFLFEELTRLGMKVVVRIEAYSDTFAFQVSDLDYVFNTYQKLIEYVCGDGKRQQVAYFALNMPVDDPQVQPEAGRRHQRRAVEAAAGGIRRGVCQTDARNHCVLRLYRRAAVPERFLWLGQQLQDSVLCLLRCGRLFHEQLFLSAQQHQAARRLRLRAKS